MVLGANGHLKLTPWRHGLVGGQVPPVSFVEKQLAAGRKARLEEELKQAESSAYLGLYFTLKTLCTE